MAMTPTKGNDVNEISVNTYRNRGRLRIRFQIGNGPDILATNSYYREDDDINTLANNLIRIASEINEEIEYEVERIRDRKLEGHARSLWPKLWGASRGIVREKALSVIPNTISQVAEHCNLNEWDGAGNPYRYLYFLVNSGEVVYIGQASHLSSRINSHRKDKIFDRVLYALYNRDDIDNVERNAISGLNPRHNIQHSDGSACNISLDEIRKWVWDNAKNKETPEVASCRPITRYV